MLTQRDAIVESFVLRGSVLPLVAMQKAMGGRPPSRPLGGWLMTYGKLGPDGGIVPTVDRDGHVAEAARELGHIDWSPYIKGGRWEDPADGRVIMGGLWNDTHDEDVIVGVPETLEFHDGTTALSKAHGKVGFWTTGHLIDRADPSSWAALQRTPTPIEFEKADHYWNLAHLLKGTPRPIGLSAHGKCALSPCKKRIIFARVYQSAVCELPVNPDATLEPMALAVAGSPLEFLRKGMIGADPCRTCRCPAGACEGLLRKAGVHAGNLGAVVPEDLEGADHSDPTGNLVQLIMQRHKVDRETAERWVVSDAHRHTTPTEGAHAC